MAIPFPDGINIGHLHYDLVNGGLWRFLGGEPAEVLHWKLIGGELVGHPDVVGWGISQAGAMWYNKALNSFFGWDGTQIISHVSISGSSSPVFVGQIVIDRGPNVNLTLTVADQTIPDILVTVVGASGIVRIRGVVAVRNAGAITTFNVRLLKNGASIGVTVRTWDAPNAATIGVSAMYFIPVEYVDNAAIPGDTYELQAASNPAPGNTFAQSGYCSLEAETRTTGMTLTTNPIGG